MVEQRKLVSLGRSSLVISLPKPWLEQNMLRQGDVLSLDVQRDRSLVVFPGSRREREVRKITLDVDPAENEASTARRIIACYLNGYREVTVASKEVLSSARQSAIREVARKLYMRIIESDSKKMLLTTLIDETKASVASAIHRMHLITASMYRDVLNSLKDKDAALAKTVSSIDDDVNHFCFFLLRLLRSAAIDPALGNQLDLSPIDCLDYQALTDKIEHVADHLTNIADNIAMLVEKHQSIPDSQLKTILAYANETLHIYDKAVKAFSSRETARANEVIERQERIQESDKEIASLASSTKSRNYVVVYASCSICDSIKRIAEYATDIAEIAIDRYYEGQPQDSFEQAPPGA